MSDQAHDRDIPEKPRGPLGDARPDAKEHEAPTDGSQPPEKVEDRPNVSIVTPESYPAADREIASPAPPRK